MTMHLYTSVLRRTLFVSCLFVLMACGGDIHEDLAHSEAAVTNGTKMDPEGTIFAAIGYPEESPSCSGTLIRNDWVLTAKHCFTASAIARPEGIIVKIGSQVASVSRVVVHPTYDVALVRLRTPLAVNGKTYGLKTHLAETKASTLLGLNITCYGYGEDQADNEEDILQSGVMRVTSTWPEIFETRPLEDYVKQLVDVGDSGGPCMVGDSVVGVNAAGDYLVHAFHVSAAAFRSWARLIMGLDSTISAMTYGDFDGDGKLEIAIGGTRRGKSGWVSIYKKSGPANWSLTAILKAKAGSHKALAPSFGSALAAGDANGDSMVDVNDILAVISVWGQLCDGCTEDLDGSGDIGVDDLLQVISNWNQDCP